MGQKWATRWNCELFVLGLHAPFFAKAPHEGFAERERAEPLLLSNAFMADSQVGDGWCNIIPVSSSPDRSSTNAQLRLVQLR